MQEFRTKLGEDGRIIIPVYFRRKLHLESGEELVIRMDKNELHLMSIKQAVKKLQQMVTQQTQGKSLVAALKKMRKEDNQ